MVRSFMHLRSDVQVLCLNAIAQTIVAKVSICMKYIDIFKCMPNEVDELTYVFEFIAYNTPGHHGYTPRDVDCRWSLSTALERELQPFQAPEEK